MKILRKPIDCWFMLEEELYRNPCLHQISLFDTLRHTPFLTILNICIKPPIFGPKLYGLCKGNEFLYCFVYWMILSDWPFGYNWKHQGGQQICMIEKTYLKQISDFKLSKKEWNFQALINRQLQMGQVSLSFTNNKWFNNYLTIYIFLRLVVEKNCYVSLAT